MYYISNSISSFLNELLSTLFDGLRWWKLLQILMKKLQILNTSNSINSHYKYKKNISSDYG